ncbi:hypothetical protein EK904_000220, partial [Melospiza melodia maxima]
VNIAIRSSLQSLREKIEQLREQLLRAVSTRQIALSTQLEGDRRQNLVDELVTRHRQLEASYRNEGPEPDMSSCAGAYWLQLQHPGMGMAQVGGTEGIVPQESP